MGKIEAMRQNGVCVMCSNYSLLSWEAEESKRLSATRRAVISQRGRCWGSNSMSLDDLYFFKAQGLIIISLLQRCCVFVLVLVSFATWICQEAILWLWVLEGFLLSWKVSQLPPLCCSLHQVHHHEEGKQSSLHWVTHPRPPPPNTYTHSRIRIFEIIMDIYNYNYFMLKSLIWRGIV